MMDRFSSLKDAHDDVTLILPNRWVVWIIPGVCGKYFRMSSGLDGEVQLSD